MEQPLLNSTSSVTLGNGLKIICCRKPSAPVVAVQVWYKTGSVKEKSGIRGISHIIEHMMFRGSTNVEPEQHSARINDTGGHCNAFTAEDVCAYLNSVPKNSLEMVLKLEADRMSGILLDGNTLETERKVIIEEYHTYMNNPVAKAFFEFRKSFYGEHPYAIGPLGVIEDIQAVSREDCLSYFNDNYSPSNAVVVIAGDIGDDAGVFEMVNRHFGGLKGSPSQARGLDICPAGGKPGYMKRIVDFDVPMVILGFPAPESSSADALPLDMMQMIVSQGESGRLHREVVRRRAVAVMAGGMNHFLRLSGMSLFFAAFTPDTSSKKVIKALEEQIERVRRDGIEPREIEKIRNTMVTNRAFDMYSADHICQRLGYSETVDGDYRIWIKRMHAINTIEPSTLLAVAKKYWAPEGRCTLYLKPRKMKPVLFLAGMARKLFTKR